MRTFIASVVVAAIALFIYLVIVNLSPLQWTELVALLNNIFFGGILVVLLSAAAGGTVYLFYGTLDSRLDRLENSAKAAGDDATKVAGEKVDEAIKHLKTGIEVASKKVENLIETNPWLKSFDPDFIALNSFSGEPILRHCVKLLREGERNAVVSWLYGVLQEKKLDLQADSAIHLSEFCRFALFDYSLALKFCERALPRPNPIGRTKSAYTSNYLSSGLVAEIVRIHCQEGRAPEAEKWASELEGLVQGGRIKWYAFKYPFVFIFIRNKTRDWRAFEALARYQAFRGNAEAAFQMLDAGRVYCATNLERSYMEVARSSAFRAVGQMAEEIAALRSAIEIHPQNFVAIKILVETLRENALFEDGQKVIDNYKTITLVPTTNHVQVEAHAWLVESLSVDDPQDQEAQDQEGPTVDY